MSITHYSEKYSYLPHFLCILQIEWDVLKMLQGSVVSIVFYFLQEKDVKVISVGG